MRHLMTRYLLTGILLLALSVLTLVQFRLLMSGVRLEKLRLDQRIDEALLAVSDSLDTPGSRSDMLINQLRRRQLFKDTTTVVPVSDSISILLANELKKKGVRAGFTFAVTTLFEDDVLLASKSFKSSEFDLGYHEITLGNHITSNCHFETVLHFDVPNLFVYLLGELRTLLVPSALSLLAILACFALLLNILAKEKKLNVIKNDFINNLTHELKTPAFSISLSSKMAKEALVKNDVQKAGTFLRLIDNENNKIKSHAEKVLELASLESSKYKLQKSEVSVNRLAQEVADEFSPQFLAIHGTLELQLSASPDLAQLDIEHLKNALRNLLDNAIKYSPQMPTVKVSTANIGKMLSISVCDNGIGIDPQYQKKVFDKFFRAPNGMTRSKGFGLGLSYVAQIAKAHGGEVSVASKPGEGSAFMIKIPA